MERGIRFGRLFKNTRALAAALVAGVLFWPVVGRAQATVPSMTPPTFQSTDLDPYLNQADAVGSVGAWEQIAGGGLAVLKAQWESSVDSQISALVGTVANTDDFNSQADYQDYVRKSLDLQKADALTAWMRAAEVTITGRRDAFAEKVADKTKKAAEAESDRNQKLAMAGYSSSLKKLDNSISNEEFAKQAGEAAQEQLLTQRRDWERDFNNKLVSGLGEYQKAMGALETDYKSILSELDASDARFQQNINDIKSYENRVRTAIGTSLTGLEAFLQSPMFQAGGDFSASAAAFQAKIDQLRAALNNSDPLSSIAGQMRDFLSADRVTAQGNADFWAGQIAKPAAQNFTSYDAGTAWGIGAVGAVKNYYDSGQNPAGLLSFVGQNDSRELLGITSADVCGATPDPYRVQGTRTCYSSNGDGAFSYSAQYDAGTCIALGLALDLTTAVLCAIATYGKTETHLDVTINYTYKDQAAETNHLKWQGYADQYGSRAQEWADSLVPAIEAWEQQRADYENEYAAWKTRADQIRIDAKNAYDQGQQSLVASRNRWHNQMLEEKKGGGRSFDRMSNELTKQMEGLGRNSGDSTLRQKLVQQSEAIFKEVFEDLPGPMAASANVREDLEAARKLLPKLEQEFLGKANQAPDSAALQALLREFQNSARGMMNATVAATMDEQARRISDTIKDQLRSMAESAGFTVTASGAGLTGTRQILAGVALLTGDPTQASGYTPEMQEQKIAFELPDAIALRSNEDLFSQWDYGTFVGDVRDQATALQGRLKEIGERNVAIIRAADAVAQRNVAHYRDSVRNQMQQAGTYRQLALTLMTGGTLQSFANQMASQELERVTGIPAGLFSGLMGGLSLGEAVQGATESLVAQHIDQATGIPGLGNLFVARLNNQQQSNDLGLDVEVSYSASNGFEASVDAGFGFGHINTDVALGPDGFDASMGVGFDVGFAEMNSVAGLDVSNEGFSGYGSVEASLDVGFASMDLNSALVFSDEGFNGYAYASAGLDLGIIEADMTAGAVFSDEGFTAMGAAGFDIGNGLLAADATAAATLSQDGFSAMGGLGLTAGWGLVDAEAAAFAAVSPDGISAGGMVSAGLGWGLVEADAAAAATVSGNGFSGMASGGVDVGNGLLVADGSAAAAISGQGITAAATAGVGVGWGLADISATGAAGLTDQGLAVAGTASAGVGWGLVDANVAAAAAASEGGFSGMASGGVDVGNGLLTADASAAAAISGQGITAAATAGMGVGWGLAETSVTGAFGLSGQGVSAAGTASAGVGWGLVDANVAAAGAVSQNGFSGMASGGLDVGNGLLAANAAGAAALSPDGFTAIGSAGVSAGWGLAEGSAVAGVSASQQGVSGIASANLGLGFGLVDANALAGLTVSESGAAGFAGAGFDVAGGLLGADALGGLSMSQQGVAAAGSAGLSAGWGLADASTAALASIDAGGVSGAASASAGVGFGLVGLQGAAAAHSDYSGNFAAGGAGAVEGAGGLFSAREGLAFAGGGSGFGPVYSINRPTPSNLMMYQFARRGI